MHGHGGRVYLDARWRRSGSWSRSTAGTTSGPSTRSTDALRQNDLVVDGEVVLRIPVLGLRLEAERFMDQVVRAHELLTATVGLLRGAEGATC